MKPQTTTVTAKVEGKTMPLQVHYRLDERRKKVTLLGIYDGYHNVEPYIGYIQRGHIRHKILTRHNVQALKQKLTNVGTPAAQEVVCKE